MNTKQARAVVGAVVAMSLVAMGVLAQPAEARRPQDPFKGPVKVFILAGQSNMEGHGGVQTLDRLGEHPTHGYLLKKIKRDDGSFVVRDDVFVSYQKADESIKRPLSVGMGAWGAEWFGPELMFGIEMGDHFKEPVLLIKTCWGGHSLYGNFRPPSAGKPAYESGYKPDEIGASYHKMVKEVRDCLAHLDTDFPLLKGLKTEICGFVWFQGWNDMCQPGDSIRQQVYDEYYPNFVHLVQDLRAEFKLPHLPIVMGELGVGGEHADKNMMDFRAAQGKIATCAELKGTLGYVRTAPFWYPELDELPRKMESEEHRVRKAVAAQLKEQLKDRPESADPQKMEQLVKKAGDEALEKDAAYQQAKRESDRHVCNWYCHYQGSARVYCLVGYSLAEAMKPLLKTAPAGMSVNTTAAASGEPPGPAWPLFRDGQAQVVKAFEDPSTWVRESLWVETEFDSDGDGRRDRVFTDVTRPGQTETEGLKVAVIYESSPYFAGTSDSKGLFWDVRQEVGELPPARTNHTRVPYQPGRTNVSEGLLKTWVPRGFAVVHSDAPGTGLSDGCVTIGGPPEALAPKAVIDWLNGRARGFRTREGSEEVRATSWCTGKVGMIGTSYNGTIPLAAATTGVKGLEAIIPVAPNTAYYHYYRSHGLVRHPGGWLGEDIDTLYDVVRSGEPARAAWGDAHIRDGLFARGRDRQSGDYNAFWAERDLLKKVRGIKAAVLMAHAFNDWNVMPEHSVRIASALKGRVPLRMYFHQGGHGGDPPLEMVNRWFSRFLYDIPNGIDKGPRAWIVRESNPGATPGKERPAPPRPTPYADYPNPQASIVTLHPGAGGGALGTLGLRLPRQQGTETLVDNVELDGAALAKAGASEHRLLYATPALLSPLHISGTPRITLRLASSKPAANLSVWLVVLPWTDGPIGPANIITRGWADPQNHASLKRGGDYHSMKRGEPLVPGKFYRLTFDLQPDDQVIPAGKRIGLMIFSSDRDFTLWPKPGTELTVDLDGTRLHLPVVGGRNWFEEAVGDGR